MLISADPALRLLLVASSLRRTKLEGHVASMESQMIDRPQVDRHLTSWLSPSFTLSRSCHTKVALSDTLTVSL